ncbi:DUF4886 domain-containing protein [Polaribacter uvawellassae]|uniref:DUF4886 domain-containing protein n=1 Tax=Polaribacter uvawellassae TaxID=3133495 RepID=UPI00321A1DAB
MLKSIIYKNYSLSLRASFFLISFFVICNYVGYSQKTKNVLFIGNSQTFYNDLPALTSNIAASLGDVLNYEESTIPSFSLKQHLNKPETMNKIRKGGWEYVILQERSSLPALWDSFVEENVYPYLQQMKDFILEHNPCAKIVLYHTWGYKQGYQNYCSTYPNLCDYNGMDDELQKRFKEMQTKFNAIISPVGPVWRNIRNSFPDIELFDPDNTHPSLKGSFTGALTFYTIIFEKDASSSTYNPGIPNLEVTKIKDVVKEVGFDNLSVWRNIILDADVKFNYQITSNLEVTFSNTTEFADSYVWDFGDGKTSTDKNPKHTYSTDGSYIITLTVNRCDKTVIKNQTITLKTLSTQSINKGIINIYPNPTKEYLYINLPNTEVKINVFSIEGRLLFEGIKPVNKNHQLDVSILNTGLYLLRITNVNNTSDFKNKLFVIQ